MLCVAWLCQLLRATIAVHGFVFTTSLSGIGCIGALKCTAMWGNQLGTTLYACNALTSSDCLALRFQTLPLICT